MGSLKLVPINFTFRENLIISECERKLKLTKDKNGIIWAEFLKSNDYWVKRRLTPGEVEKAKKLIESGDKYDIDCFCYSIA